MRIFPFLTFNADILQYKDAEKALDFGVDGIVVSNHGESFILVLFHICKLS